MSRYYKKHLGSSLIGVAAFAILVFPVVGASAASNSSNSNLSAVLGSTISVTASSPSAINVTPTPAGAQSSSNGTVSVSTNNASGYVLTIAATTPALTKGSETIPASSGTAATPVVLANNTWGYRIDNSNGFGAASSSTPLVNVASSLLTYAGVTASPVTIKSTAVPAANDITNVSYSVKANSSQESGTYTGTVTYTATTN